MSDGLVNSTTYHAYITLNSECRPSRSLRSGFSLVTLSLCCAGIHDAPLPRNANLTMLEDTQLRINFSVGESFTALVCSAIPLALGADACRFLVNIEGDEPIIKVTKLPRHGKLYQENEDG